MPATCVPLGSPGARSPLRALVPLGPGPAVPETRSAPRPVKAPLPEPDDATLVAALARGDAEALRVIFDRHAGAMLGLARRVLGDDGEAQDIVQEVLTRLWVEPDRYDACRGRLRSFLYRETHSRAIERLRSLRARRLREASPRARWAEVVPDDLEEEVVGSLRSETVRRALLGLSPDERTVIICAYYGGLTYRETATRLGLPEGTVKSRIRSGLRRLADALAAGGLDT